MSPNAHSSVRVGSSLDVVLACSLPPNQNSCTGKVSSLSEIIAWTPSRETRHVTRHGTRTTAAESSHSPRATLTSFLFRSHLARKPDYQTGQPFRTTVVMTVGTQYTVHISPKKPAKNKPRKRTGGESQLRSRLQIPVPNACSSTGSSLVCQVTK